MNIYKNIRYLKYIPYENYVLHKEPKYKFSNKLPDIFKNKLNSFLFRTYSRPIMLECETVNICTNNCIFCTYEMMTRKKTIMSLEIFEKLLNDYSEIGGGYLSLTPKSGEVFLDTLLLDRLPILDKYPKIKGLSITTNAIPLDSFSDEDLEKILSYFVRVHVSVYGLDKDEYQIITRRNSYPEMIANVNRVMELRDETKTEIIIGFRFIRNHSITDINQWIKRNFEMEIPYGYTNTYMDWNGALDEKEITLYNGNWRKREEGDSHCFFPFVLAMVYSNGDVSYCPCNDFDICEDFRLGNIEDKSLKELLVVRP